MKKTLVTVACSATLVLPSFAFAQEQVNIEVVKPQVELLTVFNTDDVTNLQVATLSEIEMKETEGALAPFVAAVFGGGAIGAWGNHAHSYKTTGQPASVSSTLKATGTGMVTGASMYGGGRAVGVARNLKFDGPSAGFKHGNGRVFGIRHHSKPVFRLDYHPNPSPTKLHIHIAPKINLHRPWHSPWKGY